MIDFRGDLTGFTAKQASLPLVLRFDVIRSEIALSWCVDDVRFVCKYFLATTGCPYGDLSNIGFAWACVVT